MDIAISSILRGHFSGESVLCGTLQCRHNDVHPLALMFPLSKHMLMPETLVKKCHLKKMQKYQPACGARWKKITGQLILSHMHYAWLKTGKICSLFYHLDSNYFNSCHHETHPDNELLTVGVSSWRKEENGGEKNKNQLILTRSQRWSQKKRQRFLQGNLKAYLKPANQLSWLTLSVTLCSLPEKGVNVRNTLLE